MKKPVHSFIGLMICLIPGIASAQCWQQLGTDLNGESEYDIAGSSLSLSNDGLTVAYGAPQNNFNSGKTRVFSWDGNTWIQKGIDIVGETLTEQGGTSVSLNADGNTIAIGSRGNDETLQNAGAVRIFHWDGNAWVQLGSSLFGNETGQGFGASVSLSDDGTTVAIGAPFKSIDVNNWSTIGLARVYRWNNTDWVQVGSDFTGTAENDWFGSSVSLNNDGNYFAVGAKFSDSNGSESGYAKVFYWNSTEWIQVGDDFTGEEGESMGASLKLNPDANSLVVGSPLCNEGGTGKGRVLVFDRVNNLWVQRGGSMHGLTAYARLGHSVGISDDGNFIVAGAVQGNGGGTNSGQIHTYYWDGGDWQLLNEVINGEAPQDFFGETADMSGSGTIVAGGANFNDGAADGAGQVRVFQSCVASVTEQNDQAFQFYPNPSSGIVECNLGEFHHSVKVQVKNVLGQIISKTTVSAQLLSVVLPENPGTYFIEVTTKNDTRIQQIIKL
jgi:hypothetical protein